LYTVYCRHRQCIQPIHQPSKVGGLCNTLSAGGECAPLVLKNTVTLSQGRAHQNDLLHDAHEQLRLSPSNESYVVDRLRVPPGPAVAAAAAGSLLRAVREEQTAQPTPAVNRHSCCCCCCCCWSAGRPAVACWQAPCMGMYMYTDLLRGHLCCSSAQLVMMPLLLLFGCRAACSCLAASSLHRHVQRYQSVNGMMGRQLATAAGQHNPVDWLQGVLHLLARQAPCRAEECKCTPICMGMRWNITRWDWQHGDCVFDVLLWMSFMLCSVLTMWIWQLFLTQTASCGLQIQTHPSAASCSQATSHAVLLLDCFVRPRCFDRNP
jgi:hypothetical protein